MSVSSTPGARPAAARAAHHLRVTCRACGGTDLLRFLELGPSPLANAFPSDPAEFAEEPFFPLDVWFCRTCTLVQVLDVIDPEVLFRDYIYVTGTSTTIRQHNEAYARTVVDRLAAGPTDLVVEVASNDGSLLLRFREHGVRTLGIEPARNIAALAEAAGVRTVAEFFTEELARSVRAAEGPARAVIGNNVLAHVDDTVGFLRGFRALLAPDGLAITEVPYLGTLLDHLEYDTVYHEHLCYFSVTALMRLCEAAGLRIVAVEPVAVHGGSIRMYAAPVETVAEHAPSVRALAATERTRGMADEATFTRFAEAVAENRRALRALLSDLQAAGKRLAAYGAPAKGNTLLNYCDIGPDLIEYTVDKNPWKVGRYTPGTHIPVLPVATLLERQPDHVLILAWNFADEIMEQESEFRRRGGRFILPVPTPRVV